jgi:hypothetical protein
VIHGEIDRWERVGANRERVRDAKEREKRERERER